MTDSTALYGSKGTDPATESFHGVSGGRTRYSASQSHSRVVSRIQRRARDRAEGERIAGIVACTGFVLCVLYVLATWLAA